VNVTDFLGRLNRVQKSRLFMIIASAVAAAVIVGGVVTYVVTRAAPETPRVAVKAPEAGTPEAANAETQKRVAAAQAAADALNRIFERRTDPTALGVGGVAVLVVALAVIWAGLGLSYLALLLVAAAVVVPLALRGTPAATSAAVFIGGLVAITASFAALMRALRIVLSGTSPVLAVARNVVDEAVRMKVSLVFMIMLIVLLASIPSLLDAHTPLRYRIQSFLQYANGGSFTLIAVLTIFLAVGTVAFEQRDKVIWQTMTKPVAHWKYLLGKWVGVSGVAAALLAVSASGVFLFTEYLRAQRANGEVAPYVSPGGYPTDDREAVETQVLAARRSVKPTLDTMPAEEMDKEIKRRITAMKDRDPNVAVTSDLLASTQHDIEKEFIQQLLSIEPARAQRYEFRGLGDARARGEPLTFRYKINSGGNDPRSTYNIAVFLPEVGSADFETVSLATVMNMQVPAQAVNSEGVLFIEVINGDPQRNIVNPATITFPTDGIEVYFNDGSYQLNYIRVVLVQWLKLACLAMLGIACATSLSFSVASLTAFGVFLIAETAGFLRSSLDNYGMTDPHTNELEVHRVIVVAIAEPIAWLFQGYAGLTPVGDLVGGRLLGWDTVGIGVLVLGGITLVLFLVGVGVFRRRELATYSGQ
jgi:ABC-type transport system involved in multi-copper enzyme maturation permease subunit